MDTFDVFVAAPAQVDYLMHLEHLPQPGQTARIETEVRVAGGSGVWFSLCFATWGFRVALLDTQITDDPNGRFLRRELESVFNLRLWPDINHEMTTPYLVHLVSSRHASFLQHKASVTSWDSSFLPESHHFVADDSHAIPHPAMFAIVYEFSSPLASQAKNVWWRGDKASAEELRSMAQDWKTDVVQIEANGSGIYCTQDGEVNCWQESESIETSPLGAVGVSEVLWAGLVWSTIQGWQWPEKISWARAAATLKRQRIGSVGMIPTQSEILEMAERLIN